jgi:hypothetical protein
MRVVIVRAGYADLRNKLENGIEGDIAETGSRAKGITFD